MSCDITSGIAKGCNTNIGGVKNVYLKNTGGTWYKYEMDKGTASLVENYNVNQASSILGFTQTLTIQLDKMEAAKQVQIQKIAQANDLQVQVETNEGTYFEFGIERGGYMASGTTTSGTAYTDANQSELVIQADSKQSMTEPTTPPINSGDIFVQYDIVPDADFTTGGFPPFATKVIDSLETTIVRPMPFTDPLVGFATNKGAAFPTNVGQAYFRNNLYTGLQAEVEFNMTIECTQDFPSSFDFTTVTLSFYDGSFATGIVWPTITAVTGMPPSVPQGPLAGDQFTVSTTTPFVIPVNQHTNTNTAVGGPVITIANTWTPGINYYFKGISGQITYRAI